MSSKVRVGVIGCGYWGPNLVRNFRRQSEAEVVAVADARPERLALMAREFPGLRTFDSAGALISDSAVDAVVIATPVATHAALAVAALKMGKHVFVEKPMAHSSADCRRMIDEAARQRRVLMTDHVFCYTGAVLSIQDLIARGELGELFYYDSTRVNLGLFQSDVNVLWDLAVHDLAILDAIAPGPPVSVSAVGHGHIKGQPENMAAMTLVYDANFVAHINVNWLSPVKVRRALIGGSKRMIVYDDIEPSHKVMVYEKGVDFVDPGQDSAQIRVSYRTGALSAPHLDGREALDRAAEHFIDCVVSGKTPLTDGHAGLRVVSILEAAARSIAAGGASVPLRELAKAA